MINYRGVGLEWVSNIFFFDNYYLIGIKIISDM